MSAGDVEGIVHNVAPDSSRVSLTETIDIDSGMPVPGVIHFYSNEIASCVVLDNTSRKEHDLVQDKDGPRLMRVRPLPAHLERLNTSVSSCEFICHRMEGDNSEEVKKGTIELVGPPDMLPKLQRPLPQEFEVIDQVNDRFHKAMAAIKNVRSVSIGFEGHDVSRHGSISVFAVATSMKVFIFDVFSLKKELFDRGLREVMESNDIEKVIHGCRQLSDCLYHLYQVSLNNVFDTMVADVVIYYSKKVDAGQQQHVPQYVRSLQTCLRSFLDLTQEQLKYTRCKRSHQEELMSATWEQRPLTLAQIDALVKDTVYLAELSRACLKQLLLRFELGVEFFLKLERDCTAQELDCLPPDHVLPAGFKDALRCGTIMAGLHRHYDNYNQDCSREYGRYGRNNENNRYQHRGGQQQWRDNGRYRMEQNRGGRMEPRGAARNQGVAMRGRVNGLLGQATEADDSLMFVAMRHQAGNRDNKPEDATAQAPVMANGHAGFGAVNGNGGNNALSGTSHFIDSEGESSGDDLPVRYGRRSGGKQHTGVGIKREAAPEDTLMSVGMRAAAALGAAVGETSTAAVGNPGGELPITGADRGEEVLRTISLDARAQADRGSPELSPNGWGTRPMENKYKDMSFRPADMQVSKYAG